MVQFITDMYSIIDNINNTPKKSTKSSCKSSKTDPKLDLSCDDAFILKYLLQSLLIIKIDGINKEDIIKSNIININNFKIFLTKYYFIRVILDNINPILVKRLIIEVNKFNETPIITRTGSRPRNADEKYNLTMDNYEKDINLIFFNPGKKGAHKTSGASTYKQNLTLEMKMIHRVYNNRFDVNIKLPDTDNEKKILKILNDIFLVVVTKIDDSLLETFNNNDLCCLKLLLIYINNIIDNIKTKLVRFDTISINNISINNICINDISITNKSKTDKPKTKPDDCKKYYTNTDNINKEILKKLTITASKSYS